ncbi:hypothetical protein Q5P01_015550 [Channa striata]|uniref:Uncharacterized protein n=1 Tax=Channa striata TaxID=64152 RepID=A0AA88MG56_CHASR|nr:hypothetical protein Q5P01_015550 [Channa striata]
MNCCRFRPSLAFLLFGVAQAAAVLPSALTCNFTHLSDGSFMYQLSKPISSPDCERYWVDDNQVVIARDSSFEKNLVVALTNRSITLRNCSDHLHYTQECNENHDSVHCRVNCSGLLEPEPLTTVNTTLTCLVGSTGLNVPPPPPPSSAPAPSLTRKHERNRRHSRSSALSCRTMWTVLITAGVVAVQMFQPPSVAAESPSALKCNIAQLQQRLRSSKCDLHWDVQNTPLSCRRSADPGITAATRLYNTSSETDHLWFRSGTVPTCSSISPPAPSTCVVCSDQFLHILCSKLRTDDGMVELEGDYHPITTIKSECPTSLGVDPVLQLMARTLSALSCSVTRLSNESSRYQLSRQHESGTKWQNQTIKWEEANCTVNCVRPTDEDPPANNTFQGSAVEAGRDKRLVGRICVFAAEFLVLSLIGLVWFFKYRQSTDSYTEALQ